MSDAVAESILALDVGAAFTKAMLFDVVEGTWRFVASGQVPSTFHPPQGDLRDGLVRATERVVELVGRPILGPRGPEVPQGASSGVDACLMVTSAGAPLRTLINCTTMAQAGAIEAELAQLSWVEVIGSVAPNTKARVRESLLGQLLTALHDRSPHLLVVEAESAEQTRLAEVGQALTIYASSGRATPTVLLLGPDESAATLRASLPSDVRVERAGKSSGSWAQLHSQLEALWREVWSGEAPGGNVELWGGADIYPASQAFVNALRFLAAYGQTDVWGLQLGAQTSVAASVVAGDVSTSTWRDLGLGQGAAGLLDCISAIKQWLPYEASDSQVADSLLPKLLFPASLPERRADLLFEGALARVVAGRALSGLIVRRASRGNPALLVGTGAAWHRASDDEAALLLLDAFQPVGLIELVVDRLGAMAALGAMARQWPEAAAALLLGDGLDRLGPAIGLGGVAKDGAPAAQVTVEIDGHKSTVQIPYGQLQSVPLGPNGKLTIKPLGKLDCGAGPGRKVAFVAGKGSRRIIIDARARPLSPSSLGTGRVERLAQWRSGLGLKG